LSAVVRVRAAETNLPPALLAGGDDLRALAANRRAPDALTGDLFTGWRGQLLGEDLRGVLSGSLTVAWDPRAGRLRLIRSVDPSAGAVA
jgi:hypothetical protein